MEYRIYKAEVIIDGMFIRNEFYVQKKVWYGWITIKIYSSDDEDYARLLAEELLEKLEE